ncbi:exocyst complex component 3-like protein 4 isoform X2 [Tachysurus fulvidraco]|uniref:exocyst complex component 3-like protein 4 isoform X2 n=1 Tax=Tachysurus fulvidraco TaxID=1234273 RepID=UPI001FF03CA0|nr:exocyst complex component 3-like protein 4 isoform X2 [Tachysurus fulvidraco]
MKSFKKTLQQVGGISPLKNKEPNTKLENTNNGNELGNSSEDPVQSPTSPKEEFTKQESGRWRLRFGSKKENPCKQEQLEVCQGVVMMSELTEETAEAWKVYKLPEIPLVPLSVMQISNLIKKNILEEAYLNILSMREEFQRELEALGEKSLPTELLNKKKDLSLLNNNLKDKLCEIVQQSSAEPPCHKELLVQVAVIIEEEENRKVAGQNEDWREVWRTAVEKGLKETLKKIHLDSHEQNVSWLAIHLGLVGKVIVEQLKKVKAELINSYPPSFNVFETYVSTINKIVREHLKWLQEKVTEAKDCYALLNFILNQYHSEKMMGNTSLQPELKEDLKTLKLEDDFLDKIKNAYCNYLQVDVRSSLDNIIKLEHDEMWKEKNKPQINEELYLSHIHMDILMNIKGPIQASSLLDMNLEHRVICCYLNELKEFPKRFESAFVQWNKTLLDPSLWTAYHITYINSFRDFKENIESYRQKCPSQVEQLSKEINGLVNRLMHALLEHFKTDTKPLLKMMMTRTWMSTEEDFKKLYKRIETLSQQCKHMCPQYVQNSVQNWLYPVGDHLQKIIGEKKSEIKNYLLPFLDEYPDFSQKHLLAVLYFRGIKRGRQRQVILQKFSDLQQRARNAGSTKHALFNEMEVAASPDCLVNMPFCSFF